jgi:hypothetical protein
MKKLVLMLVLSLGLSQAAFSVATENSEVKVSAAEQKTVLNWIKKHPKSVAALVTTLVATLGTVGYVVAKCPAQSTYFQFTKDTGEYIFVDCPKAGFDKTTAAVKAHPYYAAAGISATVVSAIILGDLLRGEKSYVKKALFGKKAKENAEVSAALVTAPAA